MKKIAILVLALLFVPVKFTNSMQQTRVIAEEIAHQEQSTIEEELEGEVFDRLSNLDFSELENALSALDDQQIKFFQSQSFYSKVASVVDGSFSETGSFFSALIALIFDDILKLVPLISTIVAISVLCSFVSAMRSETNGKSVADVVHFVCYGVVIILLIDATKQCLELASQTMSMMTKQIQAIMPVLLTLIMAVGGGTTVGVLQPTMALLCSLITTVFNNFILPIFIFSIVLSIVSNLTKTVKLEKFSSFLNSLFKWTIGITFTVFSAFISIQGISAGKFDGISYKTAKFTIKTAVPIVGGYLSDGFDLLAASTVLIKNAVGVAGLLMLAGTIIVPVVKIAIFSLCLKLLGAIIEPIGDNLTSNFVTSLSKSMPMLVGMILGVSFVYMLSVGMLVMTANYV